MRKYLLQWFGVLGLAINLLGSLDPLFQLADWARYLVGHWEYWTREILVPLIATFRIHLSSIGALTVSMDIFIILVFISSIDFRTDVGASVEATPATTVRFQKNRCLGVHYIFLLRRVCPRFKEFRPELPALCAGIGGAGGCGRSKPTS